MRINLLPKEERGRSQPLRKGMVLAILGLAVSAAAVAVFTIMHVKNVDVTRAEETVLFALVTDLRAEQGALAAQRTENDEFEAILDERARSIFVDANMATVRLLADSTLAVPEGVWLELLSIDSGEGLHAEGYAADNLDLSGFLRNLQAVPDTAHVQLETMERVLAEGRLWRKFAADLTVLEAAP